MPNTNIAGVFLEALWPAGHLKQIKTDFNFKLKYLSQGITLIIENILY